mmetsp:Transcript_31936/g.48998  ORF Transcript_31936/g.48998 Transcript_31936/m.48998 type:complete len:235 (+) Transcript_31936:77-781(+)|eukprot:CAMPEP_0195299970 /NCGR_PEP_ID=MMETSP0707-20130614/26522_1 /TAXON_ID=33640 /ORGANISM="Asterionellopsis glacialis, Strain CCMP134" /LENGTH=234 /DNA_ID=CAMNT_0040362519 /DNA_START=24 /DNA_END=728 /DNA_ORIENTATION=+
MDALGAYESEDDDSSQNSDEKAANDPDCSALSGLIAEQSSDEDEEKREPKKIKEDKTAEPSARENRVEGEQLELKENTNTKMLTTRKRKRRWDNNPDTFEVLPPPSLSESSLILWNEDYISSTFRNLSTACANVDLQQKLDHLREKSKNTSWAEQLMSQQEFHNPHFFENAIAHFGIRDPLGSTIPFGGSLQEFEFNVMATEEQTRIRQQQQQQLGVPSDFAQQQLEMAMSQRR